MKVGTNRLIKPLNYDEYTSKWALPFLDMWQSSKCCLKILRKLWMRSNFALL